MEPWAIVTITITSGLALFILLFCLKQRKNKKRLEEINNHTQLVVQAQMPPPPQQNYPSTAAYSQNYPNAYPPPPPPYASQPPMNQVYSNQQVGFVNPPMGFVPQQSPFIPSTSGQGIVNARDPQVYYNPNMPQNIAMQTNNPRMMMATTNAIVPSAPH
jgi:hypothetical protein